MVNAVERKIYFYTSSFNMGDEQRNPLDVFKRINSLPFSMGDDSRYMVIDSNTMWSMHIDDLNMPIRGRMSKIRLGDFPSFDRYGSIEPVPLPDGCTGICDFSHFIVFPIDRPAPLGRTHVIGFESNFYGPRYNNLQSYLLDKAPEIVDGVDVRYMVNRDVFAQLARSSGVTLFTMKVQRDMDQYMGYLHRNLKNYFSGIKEMSESEFIELTLSMQPRSRKDIKFEIMGKLREWVEIPGVIEGTDVLKAKVRLDNHTETLDLLEQHLLARRKVVKNNIYRSIDTNSMYSEIRNAFNELRPDINRILGVR